MSDQNPTTPTPSQTPAEPTAEPTTVVTEEPTVEATAPAEPHVDDPAPGTFADPPPTQDPEPQQTTEPESPTAEEPEPTEPEPTERVVPKPSEYELPEGMPDSIRIFANEHGFTQDQLNATLGQFGGYLQGMQQTEQKALREAGEAHLKNWGQDAQHKLGLARQALKQNDPEGKLMEALNNSGWGNHPDVLNFLYSIGKSMQEGGYLKSTVIAKPGDKSAAQSMYGDNHPSNG